jgi:Uma2 family endonuclease
MVTPKETLYRFIHYPESDGQPMADNDLQYRWIVTIKENLETLFPNDYVAADLLWYPIEGDPTIKVAPDVMVVPGRPKGIRRSYKQWEEENVAPKVVFEILSHSNTHAEMLRKQSFYRKHGVEEYYEYDPETNELGIWRRGGDFLNPVDEVSGFRSPLLDVTFELNGPDLVIRKPDGTPFETYAELHERAETERKRAESERQRAETEHERAEAAQRELEAERKSAERLKEKLRELGIDPSTLG